MNDTTDLVTIAIRTLVFLAVAGVFYFVLTSKKKEEE